MTVDVAVRMANRIVWISAQETMEVPNALSLKMMGEKLQGSRALLHTGQLFSKWPVVFD